MVWRWPGAKPFPKTMLTYSLVYITLIVYVYFRLYLHLFVLSVAMYYPLSKFQYLIFWLYNFSMRFITYSLLRMLFLSFIDPVNPLYATCKPFTRSLWSLSPVILRKFIIYLWASHGLESADILSSFVITVGIRS